MRWHACLLAAAVLLVLPTTAQEAEARHLTGTCEGVPIDVMVVIDESGSMAAWWQPTSDESQRFFSLLRSTDQSGLRGSSQSTFRILSGNHAATVSEAQAMPGSDTYDGTSSILENEITAASSEFSARGVPANADVMVILGDDGIGTWQAANAKSQGADLWVGYMGSSIPTDWSSSASSSSQAKAITSQNGLRDFFDEIMTGYGWHQQSDPPTGVSAAGHTPSPGFHTVSWNAPTDQECLVEYKVYRDGSIAGVVPKSTTAFVDGGLPCGDYSWTVSAVYENGFETDPAGPAEFQETGMAPPYGLTLDADDPVGHHGLDWEMDDTDHPCFSHYHVYRSDDGGPFSLVKDDLVENIWKDGPIPCVKHAWLVRAVDTGHVETAPTHVVTYVPPAAPMPTLSLPDELFTPDMDGFAYSHDGPYEAHYRLDWMMPASTKEHCLKEFQLQHASDDRPNGVQGAWSNVEDPVQDHDLDGKFNDEDHAYDTDLSDPGIACGEYLWRVRGKATWAAPGSSPYGPWSNVVDNGFKEVPDAPFVWTSQVATTNPWPVPETYWHARVEWDRPADNGCPIQSYEIERRFIGNLLTGNDPLQPTGWNFVASMAELDHEWQDDHTTSLPCDVFEYRVRAHNDIGPGTWSQASEYIHDPVLIEHPKCFPCEEIQKTQSDLYHKDHPIHNPLCFRTVTSQSGGGAVPGQDALGQVLDMAVDERGYVYVVGRGAAAPGSFPLHGRAPFQDNTDGAWLAVYDPSGSRVEYATYLPGTTADEIKLVAGPTPDDPVEVLVTGEAFGRPECDDGIDNDGDGAVDGADGECTGGPGLPESGAQCSDGLDNDGDGAMDYPYDKECATPGQRFESMAGAYPQADGSDAYVVRFTPFVSDRHTGTYFGGEDMEDHAQVAYDPETDTVVVGALTWSPGMPGPGSGDPDAGPDGGNDFLQARSPFVSTYSGDLGIHLAGPTYFDDDMAPWASTGFPDYRCEDNDEVALAGLEVLPRDPADPSSRTRIVVAETGHQYFDCHTDNWRADGSMTCYNAPSTKSADCSADFPACPTGKVRGGFLVDHCWGDHPCWGWPGGVFDPWANCNEWDERSTRIHYLPLDLMSDDTVYRIDDTRGTAMDLGASGDAYVVGQSIRDPVTGATMSATPDAYNAQPGGVLVNTVGAPLFPPTDRAAFLAVFNDPLAPTGPMVEYASHLGRAGSDEALDVDVSPGGVVGITGMGQVDTEIDASVSTWHPQQAQSAWVTVWDDAARGGPSWGPGYATTHPGIWGNAVYHVDRLGGIHVAGFLEMLQWPVTAFTWSGEGPCTQGAPYEPLCAGPAMSYVAWVGGIEDPCPPGSAVEECIAGACTVGLGDPECQPPCDPSVPRSCQIWLCGRLPPGACDPPSCTLTDVEGCIESVCDMLSPGPCDPPCDPLDLLSCWDVVCPGDPMSAQGTVHCAVTWCNNLTGAFCVGSLSCSDPSVPVSPPPATISGYSSWCQNGGWPGICVTTAANTACTDLPGSTACNAQTLQSLDPGKSIQCARDAADRLEGCIQQFATTGNVNEFNVCVADGQYL